MKSFSSTIVINLNVPDKRVSNSNDLFSFGINDREKILKGISSLDHIKACQETDIQHWTKHLETFHFLAQFVFTTSETELD